jgi:hypothetical protein
MNLMVKLTEHFSREEEFSIEGLAITSKPTKVKAAELVLLCELVSQMHRIGAVISYLGIRYMKSPEAVIHHTAIQSNVKSACLELDKAISALQCTLDTEDLRQTLAKDEFVFGAAAFASWAQRAQETSLALKEEVFALLVNSVEKLSDAVAEKIPKTNHIVNDKYFNKSQCKKQVLDSVAIIDLSTSATSLLEALECGAKDFAVMFGGVSMRFEDKYEAIPSCRRIFAEAKTCVILLTHLRVIQVLTDHTLPSQALLR